jgi:hypothetical protein
MPARRSGPGIAHGARGGGGGLPRVRVIGGARWAPPRGVWRPRTSLSRPAHRLSFTRAADPLTGSSDGVSEEVSAPQPFERAGRLERAQRSNGRGCRHSHRHGEEAPNFSETGRHRNGCRNDLRASDDESPSAQSVRGSRGMMPLTGTSGMSEVQLNVRFSMFDWYCASRSGSY